MKSKCVQRVILSEDSVPSGYVPLTKFGTRKHGQAGSHEYEVIHAAYRANKIDAVKLMRTPKDHSGPVFVDAKQAAALLLTAEGVSSSKQFAATEEETPSEAALATISKAIGVVNTNQLAAIRLLERIADALESIATQPKTPHQELLATLSGSANGFHN